MLLSKKAVEKEVVLALLKDYKVEVLRTQSGKR